MRRLFESLGASISIFAVSAASMAVSFTPDSARASVSESSSDPMEGVNVRLPLALTTLIYAKADAKFAEVALDIPMLTQSAIYPTLGIGHKAERTNLVFRSTGAPVRENEYVGMLGFGAQRMLTGDNASSGFLVRGDLNLLLQSKTRETADGTFQERSTLGRMLISRLELGYMLKLGRNFNVSAGGMLVAALGGRDSNYVTESPGTVNSEVIPFGFVDLGWRF
jgi:hypothetical protein